MRLPVAPCLGARAEGRAQRRPTLPWKRPGHDSSRVRRLTAVMVALAVIRVARRCSGAHQRMSQKGGQAESLNALQMMQTWPKKTRRCLRWVHRRRGQDHLRPAPTRRACHACAQPRGASALQCMSQHSVIMAPLLELFTQEEERALGLHLVRGSLDELSREVSRQEKACDDRPRSPGSPGRQSWTDWDKLNSGARSNSNAVGTTADAWGERSRSPEAMLRPPASRLSALIEQRAAARQARMLGVLASSAVDRERDGQRVGGDGHGLREQPWAWDSGAEATGHGARMQRGEASYLPRGRASGAQAWDAMGGQEVIEDSRRAQGEGPAPPTFPMVVRPASASSSSAGTPLQGEERLQARNSGPAGVQPARLPRQAQPQASYEQPPPDPFAPSWAHGKGASLDQPWRARVDVVPGPESAAAAAAAASGGRGDEGVVMELQLQVRSLERRQESLQRTVDQQQEVLRDEDMLLQALQSQLEVRAPDPATPWAVLCVALEQVCEGSTQQT